jgi:hypothetical protein
MLIYFFILLVIFSSSIGVYFYKNYAYRNFDSRYDIPFRSSFDHQNCQLDGTCLNKLSNDPTVPPRPTLRPPFLGRNKICLKSPYVAVNLPEIFFTKNYGWGVLT